MTALVNSANSSELRFCFSRTERTSFMVRAPSIAFSTVATLPPVLGAGATGGLTCGLVSGCTAGFLTGWRLFFNGSFTGLVLSWADTGKTVPTAIKAMIVMKTNATMLCRADDLVSLGSTILFILLFFVTPDSQELNHFLVGKLIASNLHECDHLFLYGQ